MISNIKISEKGKKYLKSINKPKILKINLENPKDFPIFVTIKNK